MANYMRDLRMVGDDPEARITYAFERIKSLKQTIKLCEKDGSDVARHWKREAEEEIKYLKDNMLRKDTPSPITDTDVEVATSYQVNKLIDFSKGTAYAWCHEDKNPSLAYLSRINKVKCYPCDKTFDAIDIVMHQSGLSFVEAVKYLCGK